MISVCKNASHYHSVCDFFSRKAKIRAKRIYFFDPSDSLNLPLLQPTWQPFILRVIQHQRDRNAVKLNSVRNNYEERKSNAKKKKKERGRIEERSQV